MEGGDREGERVSEREAERGGERMCVNVKRQRLEVTKWLLCSQWDDKRKSITEVKIRSLQNPHARVFFFAIYSTIHHKQLYNGQSKYSLSKLHRPMPYHPLTSARYSTKLTWTQQSEFDMDWEQTKPTYRFNSNWMDTLSKIRNSTQKRIHYGTRMGL